MTRDDITLPRATVEQALERLRKYHHGNGFAEDAECIASLESALAQEQPEPAQEPVEWLAKWANAYNGKAYTDWQKGYDDARSVVKAYLTGNHTHSQEPEHPEPAQEPADPTEYDRRNPLGGPAARFEGIAARLRAGEPYHEVLRDFGVMHIEEKQWASIPGTNVRVPLRSRPHDAGSHDQQMTPTVQRVVDAADKRARDKAAMPANCTTPNDCRAHGCHGECLPAAISTEQPGPAQEPVAWMDPENGDVLDRARHKAWQRSFGLGGKNAAARFTVALGPIRERDALLEALRQARRCLAWACEQRPEFQAEYDAADAAIKAVEEGRPCA